MDIIELIKSVILGGGATVIATQLLKQEWVPIPFEKYPRLTAAAISLISAGVAVYQANGTIFNQEGVINWLTIGLGIMVVAVVVYTNIMKQLPDSKTVL